MKTKRIGYKATYNFKCQELTYEIGKTYEIDNIKRGVCGFHYCPNIQDVLEYYNVSKDLKILEIEDIGTKRIREKNKVCCTNKIKILREVPVEEHKLFKVDKNGNIVYEKYSDNYEKWNEYDDKGNLIHETWVYDGTKNEIQYKYSHNNLVYKEHTSINCCKIERYKKWFKYDKNGNLIHEKDSYGEKKWNEYDDKGNLIHEKDSYGDEKWYKYDKNGNLIHEKDSNKYKRWYKYDKNGNLIYEKDSNGFEEWKEYDKNNNLIHEKDSYGNEIWYEYDDKGNLIYFNNKKKCYRIKTL